MKDIAFASMDVADRVDSRAVRSVLISDTAVVWLIWSIPIILSLFVRPLFPVDETRYLSVAWNMWRESQFLVPMLNDAYYTHKPPLLFWMVHAGWSVFGVNDWWPRLIQPLAASGSLLLLRGIAGHLWPCRPTIRTLAPMFFAAGWFATLYAPAVMFDYLVVFASLLALFGLTAQPTRWSLVGLGLALGLLSKGPVILVYTLPAMLAAPWWSYETRQDWKRWYVRVFVVLLAAVVPIAMWLGLAWSMAGDAFASEILWTQTANRISGEMGHGRALWWYLPFLPLVGMPWILWPPLWRAVGGMHLDRGLRLGFGSAAFGFVILSLVGGKQVHYLLPLLAIAAPAIARLADSSVRIRRWDALPLSLVFISFAIALMLPGLDLAPPSWPDWVEMISPGWGALMLMVGLALLWRKPRTAFEAGVFQLMATSTLALAVICGPVTAARGSHDLGEIAAIVNDYQMQEIPVAWLGNYQGQFDFMGRLRRPVIELKYEDARSWVASHPDAIVATRTKHLAGNVPDPLFIQTYRSGSLGLYRAAALLEHGSDVRR